MYKMQKMKNAKFTLKATNVPHLQQSSSQPVSEQHYQPMFY